jgi:hypothetical protein
VGFIRAFGAAASNGAGVSGGYERRGVDVGIVPFTVRR